MDGAVITLGFALVDCFQPPTITWFRILFQLLACRLVHYRDPEIIGLGTPELAISVQKITPHQPGCFHHDSQLTLLLLWRFKPHIGDSVHEHCHTHCTSCTSNFSHFFWQEGFLRQGKLAWIILQIDPSDFKLCSLNKHKNTGDILKIILLRYLIQKAFKQVCWNGFICK